MERIELGLQQQQESKEIRYNSNPQTTMQEKDEMNDSSRSFDFDTELDNNDYSQAETSSETKIIVAHHQQNDDGGDFPELHSTSQWRDSSSCCRSLNDDNCSSPSDRQQASTTIDDSEQRRQQQQQQRTPQLRSSLPPISPDEEKGPSFAELVNLFTNWLQNLVTSWLQNIVTKLMQFLTRIESLLLDKEVAKPDEEDVQEDCDNNEVNRNDKGVITSSVETAIVQEQPQQEYDYDRMVMLHASPLAFRDRYQTVHKFDYHDFTEEKRKIRDAFKEAHDLCGKQVDVIFDVATLDRFELALTSNTNPILHFSCHGHKDHLYLESETNWGFMNCIKKDTLKKMVTASSSSSSSGGQQTHEHLQVVFVAACHSEEIGKAFLEAGVRHVVCCPTDIKIRHTGAMVFAQSFYRALGCGRTLKEAVQIARAKVSESTEHVRSAPEEAEKYLLLPRQETLGDPDYHNVRVFYQKKKNPPLAERQRSYAIQRYLPPPPQAFRGRTIEVDEYRVLTDIRTKPITQITVGKYEADPTLLAKAVCNYLYERSQVFKIQDILWIDPKSSSIPLNDRVSRSFQRVLDMLTDNHHHFYGNVSDQSSAQPNYEECCSHIVQDIGRLNAVVFLQIRHIPMDDHAAQKKLRNFLNHMVKETQPTVKFVLIGPSGFDISGPEPVLPVSPSNSNVTLTKINMKEAEKGAKRVVDAYFAFHYPSTKLDHLDSIPRLCHSLKYLAAHVRSLQKSDANMKATSLLITDGRLEDLKKELKPATTTIRLIVWCGEGIEISKPTNNRAKTLMNSPILSAIAKRKPKLVVVCLKYGAECAANKLVQELDIDAVVIWITMDPFQKDVKWMFTMIFHPFCESFFSGKANPKECFAVLKERTIKAGCQGCDMVSQVELSGSFIRLQKPACPSAEGVKLMTHSCSTTPWFLSREVRNLKMNAGDYSLLDDAKDYISRQSTEGDPSYLFLTPEWEAVDSTEVNLKKINRKLSERARAAALYVCNEVSCDSSGIFGGGIYLVSSENDKAKVEAALAEKVESALVWIDFQRTAKTPIFENAEDLNIWVESIGKSSTVVVILTGDEKYLQHIFYLEDELYSYSTKYEHIEVKRSTGREDFPIRNLIGFVRILPLKRDEVSSEGCILDHVQYVTFLLALEKVLLPQEEGGLRDEIRVYRDDDGSVQVRLCVSDFRHLTRLRDLILMGDAAEQMCKLLPDLKQKGYSIHFDRSAMAEIYESLILQLESPTEHQQIKLEEIESKRRTHIEAPAGTGKTFVALNSTVDFLERTKSEEKVLYICRNSCLAIHFVKWLCYRMQKESGLNKTLKRLYTLSDDGTYGICSYSFNKKRGILDVSSYKKPSALSFGKIIVDDAHDIFGNHRDNIIRDLRTKARKIVERHKECELMVLSDESQASVYRDGEITYPKDLSRVQLTEVCRNSKRIVAGALAYQLPGTNHLTCAHDSVGVPLSPILFDCDSTNEMQTYAEQIIEAIGDLLQEFPGLNLHDRLAIVVPDEKFREELCCGAALGELLEKSKTQFGQLLVPKTAFEASRVLNLSDIKAEEAWIVVDCIDKLEGLERLIVFGVGLDESLADVSTPNSIVRARIYRAITRAHLAYFLINKRVEKGWFEYIEALDFEGDTFSLDDEMRKTKSDSTVTLIRENSAELLADESNVAHGSAQGRLENSVLSESEQEGSTDTKTTVDATNFKQGTWAVRKRLQKEHRNHPFFMPFKSIESESYAGNRQKHGVPEDDELAFPETEGTPTRSNVKSLSEEVDKEKDEGASLHLISPTIDTISSPPSGEKMEFEKEKVSATSLEVLSPASDTRKSDKILSETPPPKPDRKPVGRVSSFRDVVMLGHSESLDSLPVSTPTSSFVHHNKVSPMIVVEPIRRQTISMLDMHLEDTIKEEDEVHPEVSGGTEDYYHQKIRGAQARFHRKQLRPDEAKRKEHSIMRKEQQKKIQRQREAKLANEKSPKNYRLSG